jgi:hypothetical protein
METTSLKPYFTVIGLMILTALLLAFSVNVGITDEAGIKMVLPDAVGRWKGQEILYCQNPACLKEFLTKEVTERNVCPACGGSLSNASKAEKDILPPDTGLIRKRYVLPNGHTIYVSIVLSGKERSSIHRPQMCIVGQGHEIVRSKTMRVPMDDRKPLDVMTLELLRRVKNGDGQLLEYASYYTYWFVGKGRETPSHFWRTIWMATDRIFYNVAHRWAYIAVSGTRQKDSEDYKKEMISFIHDLYPHMMLYKG